MSSITKVENSTKHFLQSSQQLALCSHKELHLEILRDHYSQPSEDWQLDSIYVHIPAVLYGIL